MDEQEMEGFLHDALVTALEVDADTREENNMEPSNYDVRIFKNAGVGSGKRGLVLTIDGETFFVTIECAPWQMASCDEWQGRAYVAGARMYDTCTGKVGE